VGDRRGAAPAADASSGPAIPSPITIRSTLRTGVTSAAVPVKKISSAM
jgi:hypothetical protein